MRILFTSDLHGSRRLYDQLDDLLRSERPDLLILGGDLLADGPRENPVEIQLQYVEREFIPRIRTWRTAHPNLQIAGLLGNHDWAPAGQLLRKHHDRGEIVMLDWHQPWQCGQYTFVGYPFSPPTPHWAKDHERLDRPGDDIPDFPGLAWDADQARAVEVNFADYLHSHPSIADQLAEIPNLDQPWILVAHPPPHNTNLDRLPTVPHPIGSRAVREFILLRQPALALHGHVHESPQATGSCTERLSQTLCINPGQGHENLHAVILDPADPDNTLRHTVLK